MFNNKVLTVPASVPQGSRYLVRLICCLMLSARLTIESTGLLNLLYGVRNLGVRHRQPNLAGESCTNDWMQVAGMTASIVQLENIDPSRFFVNVFVESVKLTRMEH
jgi:hypothetical protein